MSENKRIAVFLGCIFLVLMYFHYVNKYVAPEEPSKNPAGEQTQPLTDPEKQGMDTEHVSEKEEKPIHDSDPPAQKNTETADPQTPDKTDSVSDENPEETDTAAGGTKTAEKTEAPVNEDEGEEKEIVVETAEFVAVLSTRGGALKQLRLKNFFRTSDKKETFLLIKNVEKAADSFTLRAPFLTVKDRLNYTVTEKFTAEAHILTFERTFGSVSVTKKYVFPAKGFKFQFHIRIANNGTRPIEDDFTLVTVSAICPSTENSDSGRSYYNRQAVAGFRKSGGDFFTERTSVSKINREKPFVFSKENRIVWGAVRNKYFAVIGVPTETEYTLVSRKIIEKPTPGSSENLPAVHEYNNLEFKLEHAVIEPDASWNESLNIFAGPTSMKLLKSEENAKLNFIEVMDWGRFGFLIKALIWLMAAIYSVIRSYGIAIIILTCLVRLLMYPLTHKMLVSQHKMKAVQPKIQKLKEQYKNDRQKLGQAQMQLFKEEGINPLGGCFPMLLQLPIFIALFWTFNMAFEIRHQSFLWIDDLSLPDSLFTFSANLPIVGNQFNLLPVLFVVINIIQMRMTPSAGADPAMEQQQKIMQTVFPLVFFFIFYSMPAALVMYFVVSGFWTLTEHRFIRKRLENRLEAAEQNAVSASGGSNRK